MQIGIKHVNTHLYSLEAAKFKKRGFYIDAPPGTKDFIEYWKEQSKYCKEGYSVGGVPITGNHYAYLNFGQIMLTRNENKEARISKTHLRTGRKIKTFPDFWDGDYEYFHIVDIAKNGITKEGLEKLGLSVKIYNTEGGLNVIVAKARRKGFSYKNGFIVANTYNQFKNTTSIIGAFEKKYLYPEGTMSMASNYLNFFNEHTAWTKRRQVVDKQDHRRASYIEYVNGIPIEKGYKSQIIAVTFKDNPDAARGKDAVLILLEECGAFDNLKNSYMATLPTVKDGSVSTGQILMYGTGGDMEGGTIDFEDMFYNPEPYDLLPVENIWDEDGFGTSCGFFFPDYKNKIGFIDKNGNSKQEEAKKSEIAIRTEKKKTAKDLRSVDKYITEHAFSPKEAFLRVNSNIFPVAELNNWRNKVEINKYYKHIGITGELYRNENGIVKFRPNSKLKPVIKFPTEKGSDLTGAIVQYQAPYRIGGEIPKNMYLIVHDPYGSDSSNGASLGAAYVIKRPNGLSEPNDIIVASYVGRPKFQDDYNYNLFLLAEYYNAKIGFENDRGEVVPYAKRYKKLNYLMEEPEIIDIKAGRKFSKLGRKYGMSMGSKERKFQAQIYLRDWLLTQRGKDEYGNELLNLHKIYDLALLDELIRYNNYGNFDRVSALLVGTYYMKYLFTKQVKKIMEEIEHDRGSDSFFERQLF